MKRLILAALCVFGWGLAAWAAPPAVLTSLRAIHLLNHQDASRALPVAFEATVTYVFPNYEKQSLRALFVQDDDVAIYLQATTNKAIIPGDRILIRGTTVNSFRPFVHSDDIAVLHHVALPRPFRANFSQLIRGQHDSILITVHGLLRAAEPEAASHLLSTWLPIRTSEGEIEAVVDSGDTASFESLLDAEVEVTGVAGGIFDGKRQQTGVLLHVSSLADVKVLTRAGADPWSLPITAMDEILAGYRVNNLTSRIRVQGTITYYQPGSVVVLQKGNKSLWIETPTVAPLRGRSGGGRRLSRGEERLFEPQQQRSQEQPSAGAGRIPTGQLGGTQFQPTRLRSSLN